jgi:hypothetical protein
MCLDNPVDNPDPNLNLHQFMMGKGKTSVFTPLLAFAILLLKEKQSTIITMDHLVKPTREYTIFIENITDLKVQIYSDFEAKKRWLEHTDIKLKEEIKEQANKMEDILKKDRELHEKDDRKLPKEAKKHLTDRINEIRNTHFENEMNIIDEFDSHHNYLQSMFNNVKEKMSINERLFRYIFEFTFNKINKIPITKYALDHTDNNELIKNPDLFNENLTNYYKSYKISGVYI